MGQIESWKLYLGRSGPNGHFAAAELAAASEIVAKNRFPVDCKQAFERTFPGRLAKRGVYLSFSDFRLADIGRLLASLKEKAAHLEVEVRCRDEQLLEALEKGLEPKGYPLKAGEAGSWKVIPE